MPVLRNSSLGSAKGLGCRFPLLPFALCLLPFASGASFAAAAEPVTVNVWQLPTKEARTVDERADLAVMHRFLELHPDLRMQGFRGVTAPGLSMDAQPLLAMAGGIA